MEGLGLLPNRRFVCFQKPTRLIDAALEEVPSSPDRTGLVNDQDGSRQRAERLGNQPTGWKAHSNSMCLIIRLMIQEIYILLYESYIPITWLIIRLYKPHTTLLKPHNRIRRLVQEVCGALV